MKPVRCMCIYLHIFRLHLFLMNNKNNDIIRIKYLSAQEIIDYNTSSSSG